MLSRLAASCLMFMFAALALVGAAPTPSLADSGGISITITKAGLVVGVTAGSGTLHFRGKAYELGIGGLRLGLTIGVSTAHLDGTAFNLDSPRDIEGTYLSSSASAAAVVGADNLVLTNSRGVRLELRGRQAGLEASLDAGGMNIQLK